MKTLLTLLIAQLTACLVLAQDGFFLTVGGVNGEAEDGHSLEGQFGTIYRSEDGELWTEVFRGGPVKEGFSHATNNLLRCMTYGNGRFVVTGNPAAVVTSTDGENWEIVEAPRGSMSVEYGNGIFVAPNASSFMTSTDGLTWEDHKPEVSFGIWGEDGAGHVRKIVYGNGVFVCVGEQRMGVTDGKQWLHHELLPADQRPGRNVLLFGNGRFVWLCENIPSRHSENGIHWEEIDFSQHKGEGKFGLNGVFAGEFFWTAAPVWNEENKTTYRSTDGITWEPVSESRDLPTITTAGNGMLLANVGHARSFRFSRDQGASWMEVKVDVGSRKVYFFGGERIVGQSGG